jgi:hypothetical protein
MAILSATMNAVEFTTELFLCDDSSEDSIYDPLRAT